MVMSVLMSVLPSPDLLPLELSPAGQEPGAVVSSPQPWQRRWYQGVNMFAVFQHAPCLLATPTHTYIHIEPA